MSHEWDYQYHVAPGKSGTVQMHFKEVNHVDIKLGQPLPYDVYDRNGLLVLRAGALINTLPHLNLLLDAGLYMLHQESPALIRHKVVHDSEQHAFEMMEALKEQLCNLFNHVRHERAQEIFVRQIHAIATHIQEICTHDTDAALACLLLDHETSYIVQHSLHAAVAMGMVSYMLDVTDDKRETMICAALTHDIGILDVQDDLEAQQGPLTEQQKQRIQRHPIDGAAMLSKLGVNDPIWLNTVKQHHERLDGSGYPEHLSGAVIKIPARLLAISDSYSAMVRVRPYRKAMVSKQAMRNLMVEQHGKLDHRLVEMLIKSSGIFPAGVFVKLANGEVGVVKKQLKNSTAPLVYAFIKADGEARFTPVLRDSSEPLYAVKGIIAADHYHGYLPMLRSLWIKQ